MKYQDLLAGLSRLGFSRKTNEKKQIFFHLPPSNAVIGLPVLQPGTMVPGILMQNIRKFLDLKKILPDSAFDRHFAAAGKQAMDYKKGTIKPLSSEEWKQVQFPGWKELQHRYALSSYGRVASYKHDVLQDGKLLQGTISTGYKTLRLPRSGGKSTIYIHREIARLFHKKPSAKHKYVIHINHNKMDNSIKNLQWATQEQMVEHQQKILYGIVYKKIQAKRTIGLKLNAAKVKELKESLRSANRAESLKQLARQYGIHEKKKYSERETK